MDYQFEYVEGTDHQIKVLYKLLLDRKHSISHKETPGYDAHECFVKNHPYDYWFLVRSGENYLGTFYGKKDNSIGLNLNVIKKDLVEHCLKFIKNSYSPRAVKASVTPDYFYINVATSNIELIQVMKALQLPQLQVSFKLKDE